MDEQPKITPTVKPGKPPMCGGHACPQCLEFMPCDDGHPLHKDNCALSGESWPRICVPAVLRMAEKVEKHEQFIRAIKMAYKKHCLDMSDIGWDELSDCLCDALCEALGDKGFRAWVLSETENSDG